MAGLEAAGPEPVPGDLHEDRDRLCHDPQLLREHAKNTHGIDMATGLPPTAQQRLEHSEPGSPRETK